jgi:GTP pyrophosphokinase
MGDVSRLRKGASVLDFAYSIHSKLGHQCTGGLVNGKAVSYKHRLSNGDVVEVRTSPKQRPKQEWLQFLTSAKSRQHVKRALRVAEQKGHEEGKETLIRKLKKWGTPFNDETIDILLRHFKYTNATELYALISSERIDLNIMKSVLQESRSKAIVKSKKSSKELVVEKELIEEEHFEGDYLIIDDQIDQVGYRRAQCCKPKKGDKVFGFVTVNKGISIHKTDCRNTLDLITRFPYRIIKVRWKTD